MSNTTRYSKNQLKRYPIYLNYLKSLNFSKDDYISTSQLSEALGFNNEVIKKDIALISSEKGLPKKGRNISRLILDLEKFLGTNAKNNAVIIGVGHLGRALLNFDGFKEIGLNILAGFDKDPQLYEIDINGKIIYSLNDLKNYVIANKVEIAIITVPTSSAQKVVDECYDAGIRAFWNFAPKTINYKEDVAVVNTNMASSFSVLLHEINLKKKI